MITNIIEKGEIFFKNEKMKTYDQVFEESSAYPIAIFTQFMSLLLPSNSLTF